MSIKIILINYSQRFILRLQTQLPHNNLVSIFYNGNNILITQWNRFSDIIEVIIYCKALSFVRITRKK